jgi:hypothetical protein
MNPLLNQGNIRRGTMALLAIAAMLFLASGLTILHLHQDGPETTCHICQALHMPALVAERLDNLAAPERISWNLALPDEAVPSDTFESNHASRAPPSV